MSWGDIGQGRHEERQRQGETWGRGKGSIKSKVLTASSHTENMFKRIINSLLRVPTDLTTIYFHDFSMTIS